MNQTLRRKLISLAKKNITTTDSAHDFEHASRVLYNAEYLAQKEGGSLDVLVPSALFHDLVNIEKDAINASCAPKKSAEKVGQILPTIDAYQDTQLLDRVKKAIICTSYSVAIKPQSLEEKIMQDADNLEKSGAIAVMRTFSSVGRMKAKLYHPEDPFCNARQPNPKIYGLDLISAKLLEVKDSLNTQTAQQLIKGKEQFLMEFLQQFRREYQYK